MEIKDRNVEYAGRKKMIIVDANNNPIESKEPCLVKLTREEGEVYEQGTPLNKETLDMANWRHHGTLSFKNKTNETLPDSILNETQIATTVDGRTWLISGNGIVTELTKKNTAVSVNGIIQNEWNADSKQNVLSNEQMEVLNKETNKQDALSDLQLANINAIPNKLDITAAAADSQKLGGLMPTDFARASDTNNHILNNNVHVSSSEKLLWNGKTTMQIQSSIPTSLADNTICFVV